MKRVIVTADDFGLTRGINAGIIDAHTRGIVTAASLVAVGDAFIDAVDLARRHRSLDIGVHLVLDEERPIVDGLRSLVTGNGTFLTRNQLVARLLSGAIDLDEVSACWRAQIRRCVDAGLRPSFLNSHGHVHVWPTLFRIVQRLAADFHITAVRRPVELAWPTTDFGRWMKDAAITSTALLSMRNLSGLRTTDAFRGLSRSGRLTAADVDRFFGTAPAGLTELMAHPGEGDEATQTRYRLWGYDWSGERRALIEASPSGITLTTFAAEFRAASAS